jgi:hypothetical protein
MRYTNSMEKEFEVIEDMQAKERFVCGKIPNVKW